MIKQQVPTGRAPSPAGAAGLGPHDAATGPATHMITALIRSPRDEEPEL